MLVFDCSKAIDTYRFSTMFSKLLDTGMPPIVVMIFMYMYSSSMLGSSGVSQSPPGLGSEIVPGRDPWPAQLFGQCI